MKQIEDLIDLLNEYDKPVDEDERVYSEYSGNFLRGEREDMERMSPEKLCGKKFGFIKWLVDNDKIKYYKVPEHIHVSDYSFETIHEGMTDNILMWLAIQDEPTEFLCSILK